MNYTFPKDFVWGVGGSAFQMEGAMLEDGKTLNVREASFFTKEGPREKFIDSRSPEVCADFYHRYPEDLKLMGELGPKMFRYSIAWTRIIPSRDAEPNQKAIDYYNNVIDTMIAEGITPFMDLFHSDLPLWVVENGGIADPRFVEWYARYVEVCFRAFGDRVKFWSTVNEPIYSVFAAYSTARQMPFERDQGKAFRATFHMILAHFRAVKLLRQLWPDAKIGAVSNFSDVYCFSHDPKEIAAAQRSMCIPLHILDPMVRGKYPEEVLSWPKTRALITDDMIRAVAENFVPLDFVGLNVYCSKYARHCDDSLFGTRTMKDVPVPRDGYGFATYPSGTFDALVLLQDRYDGLPMYITENGFAQTRKDTSDMDLEPFRHDEDRIRYIREHLRSCARAIRAGVNLKGYFYWSFMDTWEVARGFTVPMGLVGINYDTLERQPRDSFYYYQKIMQTNMVD